MGVFLIIVHQNTTLHDALISSHLFIIAGDESASARAEKHF